MSQRQIELENRVGNIGYIDSQTELVLSKKSENSNDSQKKTRQNKRWLIQMK